MYVDFKLKNTFRLLHKNNTVLQGLMAGRGWNTIVGTSHLFINPRSIEDVRVTLIDLNC